MNGRTRNVTVKLGRDKGEKRTVFWVRDVWTLQRGGGGVMHSGVNKIGGRQLLRQQIYVPLTKTQKSHYRKKKEIT